MFRRGEEGRHAQGPGTNRDEEHREHGPIQPSEVSGMRDQVSGGPEVTVVGKGARIEGNLISAGSLRIDGQIKGKITAEGDVTLSPQSEVDADIKATNVTVGGNFKGNVQAANRAELASGGRVEGNVTCKVLVVAEGAIFTGQSIMDGRTPAAATAATAATAGAGTEAASGEASSKGERPEPEKSAAR